MRQKVGSSWEEIEPELYSMVFFVEGSWVPRTSFEISLYDVGACYGTTEDVLHAQVQTIRYRHPMSAESLRDPTLCH